MGILWFVGNRSASRLERETRHFSFPPSSTESSPGRVHETSSAEEKKGRRICRPSGHRQRATLVATYCFPAEGKKAHKESTFSGWISFAIEIPSSFSSSPFDQLRFSRCCSLSVPQDGDIFVSPDHPISGSAPWTQQSQGCGRPGDFVYLPRSFVASTKSGGGGEKKREERGSISGDNGNQSTAEVNNATAVRIGDEIR